MSTTLSGNLGVSLNTSYKNAGTRTTAKADTNQTYTLTLTNGTASGQANRHYQARLTVGAAGSVTINLGDGSIVDVLGAALTFVKVKHMVLKAVSGNGNKVTMGAAGTNPFDGPLGGTTPTFDLEVDSVNMFSAPGAGWTVDGTHQQLKFANAGGAACYIDIDIYGTDA